MRYSLPVILALSLMNLHLLFRPVASLEPAPNLETREYRFCMQKDLELLKAQDEIRILQMIVAGYRENRDTGHTDAAPMNTPLTSEVASLHDEIHTLRKMVHGYRDANTHQLRLSAYTARPEETNDDVDNTAIMQDPVPGWTVAVSRDLKGWLGKRVYIEGFGVRLVSDLMNTRFDQAIDVLVPDVSTARGIGVQDNVLVTLVEPLATDVTDIDSELLAMLAKPSDNPPLP